jgi:hypothetical protein
MIIGGVIATFCIRRRKQQRKETSLCPDIVYATAHAGWSTQPQNIKRVDSGRPPPYEL